jgi:hypothetical protein
VAITNEVVRFESPGVDRVLRDQLARGVAKYMDEQEFDPSVAAVADTNPASLTNGISAPAPSRDPAADIGSLISAFVAGGGHLENSSFVLSTQNAIALRLTGHDAFRILARNGGEIAGVPAVASDSVGDRVVLLDLDRIAVADDGRMDVSVGPGSALEMSDAPTQSGLTGTGSAMVSLWGSNLTALKIIRYVNWQALTGAVALIDSANYFAARSPATVSNGC